MKERKIYTRTGDQGETALADGSRTNKNDLRVECYGIIDELNSLLGIVRQYIAELPEQQRQKLDQWLEAVQNDLFNIGTDIATPVTRRWPGMEPVDGKEVEILEKLIDYCNRDLPVLKEFLLPGGNKSCAFLHCARTICRKAERALVGLQREKQINEFLLPYLNRLSDFLFILSRWTVFHTRAQEIKWSKGGGLRGLERTLYEK